MTWPIEVDLSGVGRSYSVLPLADVCVGTHEWPPLVQIEIKDVVNVGDHRNFVLHVIRVECHAISTHHGMRDLFLLEELPPIVLLLQIVRVEAVLDIFSLHPEHCFDGVLITTFATVCRRDATMFLIMLSLEPASLLVFVLGVLFSLLLSFLHVFQLPLHVVVVIVVAVVR